MTVIICGETYAWRKKEKKTELTKAPHSTTCREIRSCFLEIWIGKTDWLRAHVNCYSCYCDILGGSVINMLMVCLLSQIFIDQILQLISCSSVWQRDLNENKPLVIQLGWDVSSAFKGNRQRLCLQHTLRLQWSYRCASEIGRFVSFGYSRITGKQL